MAAQYLPGQGYSSAVTGPKRQGKVSVSLAENLKAKTSTKHISWEELRHRQRNTLQPGSVPIFCLKIEKNTFNGNGSPTRLELSAFDGYNFLTEVDMPTQTVRERTDRRRERLRQVLAQRQPDLTLVLANIHDPHNVSAIFRSADAFGLERVHLYYTDTAFPALSRKTSASARKWVESVRHTSKEELSQALQGMQILVTSCSPHSRAMGNFDFTQPTALIMGNEHSGVASELLDLAHGELYIPMYGMIQSFNVSVAAAIILAEAARQRQAAGFYDHPRYSEEELNAHLTSWLEK